MRADSKYELGLSPVEFVYISSVTEPGDKSFGADVSDLTFWRTILKTRVKREGLPFQDCTRSGGWRY